MILGRRSWMEVAGLVDAIDAQDYGYHAKQHTLFILPVD